MKNQLIQIRNYSRNYTVWSNLFRHMAGSTLGKNLSLDSLLGRVWKNCRVATEAANLTYISNENRCYEV